MNTAVRHLHPAHVELKNTEHTVGPQHVNHNSVNLNISYILDVICKQGNNTVNLNI